MPLGKVAGTATLVLRQIVTGFYLSPFAWDMLLHYLDKLLDPGIFRRSCSRVRTVFSLCCNLGIMRN